MSDESAARIRQRTRRAVTARSTWLVAASAALVMAGAAAAVSAQSAEPGPIVRGRFVVETNAFVIAQAADWLDDEHIVWHDAMIRDEDGDGQTHIYRSTLDGAEKVCLTCGLDGPNQVPVVQPHGEWILFHSWNGHQVRVGAPGFGGLGSEIWAMRRDGSQRTNLTANGELHDNFHAYWSPDGQYIVWTALNWNTDDGGNGKSEVRVARFDPDGPSGPRLVDARVVRPGNGHWYETQWWAPDGSGFLFTETAETAINPELFFCRLPAPGYGRCRTVRLTHDPAWDEQAIFTPEMDKILFMSSRNLPGAHNDWAQIATFLKIPAVFDYELVFQVFSDGFLQPVLEQATDLYEMSLRWNRNHTWFKPGPIRRLTSSGEVGWVIPEFAWDPSGQRLLWTQNRFGSSRRVDQGCVMRAIRAEIIHRLSGVTSLAQIPLDLVPRIRTQATSLLQDPKAFSYGSFDCGGTNPSDPARLSQETKIAHYNPPP